MPVPTIEYSHGSIRILDQTKLPLQKEFLVVNSMEDMWDAIKKLKIRGAPAIGIAAAFGIFLGIRDYNGTDRVRFRQTVHEACCYMGSSRPTAVNLFWAIDRIEKFVQQRGELSVKALKNRILEEAIRMIEEDKRICRSIGEHGVGLIRDGYNLLTHCNAGGLATAMYGTALAPIFKAKEKGIRIHVYVDETRPLLQGARITAWELLESQIPATLITDSTAAFTMARKKINMVIVGADRIAANGDTANKIGTLGVAVLAKEFNVPFYVAAPTSTIDVNTLSGESIPI
jgi:methylthioribose-1-phosphate isomerase